MTNSKTNPERTACCGACDCTNCSCGCAPGECRCAETNCGCGCRETAGR